MNTETSQGSLGSSISSTSSSNTLNGSTDSTGVVRRVAQKAHEAVDMLEQTVSTGSEKVTGWQQEYGKSAREQVTANPLAAVGVAFVVGMLVGRIVL